MLTETPLLMAFEKKTYRKIRQKVPIKTLLKTSPIFFSKKDRIENLLNKYGANVPYKLLGKIRSHEKSVLKRSSKNFCTEILAKTPENLDFEKRQYQKSCQKACRSQKLLTKPLKHRSQETGANQEAHQTVTEQRTRQKRPWQFFDKKTASKYFLVSSVQKGWPKNR